MDGYKTSQRGFRYSDYISHYDSQESCSPSLSENRTASPHEVYRTQTVNASQDDSFSKHAQLSSGRFSWNYETNQASISEVGSNHESQSEGNGPDEQLDSGVAYMYADQDYSFSSGSDQLVDEPEGPETFVTWGQIYEARTTTNASVSESEATSGSSVVIHAIDDYLRTVASDSLADGASSSEDSSSSEVTSPKSPFIRARAGYRAKWYTCHRHLHQLYRSDSDGEEDQLSSEHGDCDKDVMHQGTLEGHIESETFDGGYYADDEDEC
ncbi:hypothetical protein FRB99_001994 [Tulasnella sp. 403]|nr:hypothetical protein FRB99_001994 [Tulasnella sp. 403]